MKREGRNAGESVGRRVDSPSLIRVRVVNKQNLSMELLESRCLRLRLSECSFPGNQGVKTLQVLGPPFLPERSPRSIESISHSEITCRIHVLSDRSPLLSNFLKSRVITQLPNDKYFACARQHQPLKGPFLTYLGSPWAGSGTRDIALLFRFRFI